MNVRAVSKQAPRFVRFASSSAAPKGGSSSGNNSGSQQPQGNNADWLVNLSASGDANAEAQRWIDAMKTLRQKWTPQGQRFDIDKAFAPEGMDEDYDFWAAADAEIAIRKRNAAIALTGGKQSGSDALEALTPEQLQEAEAVQGTPIPPKKDIWMNMLVNQVMRHGEKAKAYKTVNRALYLAFLKLRQDPVALLMTALDKMAPLAQLHRIGDGGARVEVFPVPYSATKRIGIAWKWVIEASQRRQSRDFAVRLGEEIVSAIEGKSPGFEKSSAIHKSAVANRSVAEEVQQGRWKR